MIDDGEIVIAGAGPVGLTLANLLGVHGVAALLVEQRDALAGEPRAVALDDEAMRVMQAAGLAEVIAPAMLMGYDHHVFGRKGQLILKIDPAAREHGFPKRNRFHQPVLEGQLLAGLDRFPHVRTAFATRLDAFAIDEEGVRLVLDQAGTRQEMRCRFLIGCDGGNSVVRRLAGIRMEGESHPEPWIVIDTEDNPDTARFSRAHGDPNRPSVNVPGVEGRRRYEFMLLPGEDPEVAVSDASVRTLLAPYCDVAHVRVTRRVVYTFHSLVAERFGEQGRVFLAGDAAHMMPPFQGQGMNSGIRDAAMLAWRLEAVLRGRIGAGVLQSYDTERRPHAQAMIALSARVGRLLMTRNPLRARLRDAVLGLLSRFPRTAGYLRNMRFKPAPVAHDGFFLADSAGLAGRLFPQPEVLDGSGRIVRLDTLLGSGFALLHLADRAEAFEGGFDHPLWQALGARRVLVLPGGLSPASHPIDAVAGDLAGEIRRAAAVEGPVSLLLRADRYVAAILRPGEEDEAAERLLAKIR